MITINKENVCVVVPWHNNAQRALFEAAWGDCSHVIFQQDETKAGCARTKNAGIAQAVAQGADIVIVLDDDCFPNERQSIDSLIRDHIAALNPIPVQMFDPVTDPWSRGTPYYSRSITMPVAASMGFWSHIGDYDAPGQLVHGARTPMKFKPYAMYGRYFPLCGMNLSFRPKQWFPWYRFIDVPRFDDIWAGWLWQKEAYRRGYCFNLAGPIVRHSRQSNVWQNLRDEAVHLERNETLWSDIATSPATSYDELRKLLPV